MKTKNKKRNKLTNKQKQKSRYQMKSHRKQFFDLTQLENCKMYNLTLLLKVLWGGSQWFRLDDSKLAHFGFSIICYDDINVVR